MAYIPRRDDEERALLRSAAPTAAPSGGTPAAMGAPAAAAPPQGSGWVNLQRVLNANRAEGEELAGRLTSGVATKSTDVRGRVDGEYQRLAAGGAEGNLGALAADAAEVDQRAGALATHGGRAALLSESHTGPYGEGAKALDAATSYGAADAAKGFGGLEAYLTTTLDGARKAAADAKAAKDALQKGVLAGTPAPNPMVPPTFVPATPPPPILGPSFEDEFRRRKGQR